MDAVRADVDAWYRRYNECCNEHRFGELGEFVAEGVVVNGAVQGLAGYTAGLRAVVDAFPDYRWGLRQLLVDGGWLAAHLHDTGTYRGPSSACRRPGAGWPPRSSRSTGSPLARSPRCG